MLGAGLMLVPPSVEVLRLDSAVGVSRGGQGPQLVLPPALRELHINLDHWNIDEVRMLP